MRRSNRDYMRTVPGRRAVHIWEHTGTHGADVQATCLRSMVASSRVCGPSRVTTCAFSALLRPGSGNEPHQDGGRPCSGATTTPTAPSFTATASSLATFASSGRRLIVRSGPSSTAAIVTQRCRVYKLASRRTRCELQRGDLASARSTRRGSRRGRFGRRKRPQSQESARRGVCGQRLHRLLLGLRGHMASFAGFVTRNLTALLAV